MHTPYAPIRLPLKNKGYDSQYIQYKYMILKSKYKLIFFEIFHKLHIM